MFPTTTPDNVRIPPTGFDTPASPFSTLDPNIAKQMAALSQYSLARNAATGRPLINGGLSAPANGSGFSGQLAATNDPISAPSISVDSSAPQQPSTDMQARPGANAADAIKQRQRSFYTSLAQFMTSRGTPLPPGVVGLPWPQGYDPSSSPFKIIEQGSEPGAFRLAGKDINLFKLWTTIMAAGGASKISQLNGWGSVLQAMELPEQMPNPNPQNTAGATVAVLPYLVRHYQVLLHPFAEWYVRNLQDNQRKAMAARQQQQGAGEGQAQSTAPTPAAAATPIPPAATPAPETPAAETTNSQPTSTAPAPTPTPQQETEPVTSEGSESDPQGLKRKYEAEIPESKRTRPRTESDLSEPKPTTSDTDPSGAPEANAAPSAPATSMPLESPKKTTQKVEYLPLARQLETHGGRDLRMVESELHKATRRPLRDHNDWGIIEVDVLTLFIRSRIPADLAYALTTFTLLSTMRGQVPGSGFPIHNCPELFDEVLDLMEDEAFGETPDTEATAADDEIFTNNLLIKTFREAESAPFAILDKNRPLMRRRSLDKGGPRQPASNLIKAVMNIIRNLSVITDNQSWLGRQKRMLSVMLRLCEVVRDKDGTLHPASPVLSLGDVVVIRKDTINIVANIALHVGLSTKPIVSLVAKRMFKLAASYLIDPTEAVHPVACIHHSGTGTLVSPPKLADLALEAFTRLSGPDPNRQVFSKLIQERHLWSVIEALVHRLPVDDADYQLGLREPWLSYIEKNVFSLYSLFFLASPQLKKKVKSNRRLGATAVMMRMVTKFMLVGEIRAWYQICAKRTIEALKVLDDAEDSFTAPTSNVSSTLSFGIGYGEGEITFERGTGLWGGHWDSAWDLLMLRDLDGETFGELESLLRVEA